MIDQLTTRLGRKLHEVPGGFNCAACRRKAQAIVSDTLAAAPEPKEKS
jgi:bacterioferritin-associated ferredoxin